MEDKLPVYYLDIEDNDMSSGVDAISFVDKPAIEVEWVKFNKQRKEKFDVNQSKRIVTSPVMLAETPIYRYEESLGEYYVKYSADTIFRMRNKYIMDGKQNRVNEMHDSSKPVQNVFMVESFIVGDKVESKLFNVPEGTWVASFYIPDETYWNEKIMSEEFGGFSLEGWFVENYEYNAIEKKCNDIKDILESDVHDLVKEKKIQRILDKVKKD